MSEEKPPRDQRAIAAIDAVTAAQELLHRAADGKLSVEHHRRISAVRIDGVDLVEKASAEQRQIEPAAVLKWSGVEDGRPN